VRRPITSWMPTNERSPPRPKPRPPHRPTNLWQEEHLTIFLNIVWISLSRYCMLLSSIACFSDIVQPYSQSCNNKTIYVMKNYIWPPNQWVLLYTDTSYNERTRSNLDTHTHTSRELILTRGQKATYPHTHTSREFILTRGEKAIRS